MRVRCEVDNVSLRNENEINEPTTNRHVPDSEGHAEAKDERRRMDGKGKRGTKVERTVGNAGARHSPLIRTGG